MALGPGCAGDEGMELLVAKSVGGAVGEQGPQSSDGPARLLEDLPSGSFLENLAGVDAAGGNLPSLLVRDEPMPPHEKNVSVLVVDHHADCRPRHAHNVMSEPVSLTSTRERLTHSLR